MLPDLMPLEISQEWIDRIKASMPELPEQKRQRYMGLGLSEYDASVIVAQYELAMFFDKVLELGANPKMAVNFMMGEIAAYLKEQKLSINDSKLTPENLVELISLIEKATISNNIGKQIIADMLANGEKASDIVEKKGRQSQPSISKQIIKRYVRLAKREIY